MKVKNEGVLTGCNEHQEWMLKIWWHYYRQTNTHPVTFIDFGMTKSARAWCSEHGNVISVTLPHYIPAPQEKIDLERQQIWEQCYPKLWTARKGWFLKPFAFLKTPYENTVWVDLDTLIIKPLTPLFEAAEKTGIALVREVTRAVEKGLSLKLFLPDEDIYNSGVIAYRSGLPIMHKWAKKACEESHLFLGDQEILNRLIYEEKTPVFELPSVFNRRPRDGIDQGTFIIHFAGNAKGHLFETFYRPFLFQQTAAK